MRLRFSTLALLAFLLAPLAAVAQPADGPKRLTLETLFASPEFYGESFQGGRWAETGARLLYVEGDASGASSLRELDLTTDTRRTILDGSQLVKPDAEGLIEIEDYATSMDGAKTLLYTDSERVWRLNTKGYYYVLDNESGTVTPVADRAAGFQMFAKFDPGAEHVAFVRDRNLFVVDLATGTERALTDNGSEGGVINGTFDWVYEEEFGLRDGFRYGIGRRLRGRLGDFGRRLRSGFGLGFRDGLGFGLRCRLGHGLRGRRRHRLRRRRGCGRLHCFARGRAGCRQSVEIDLVLAGILGVLVGLRRFFGRLRIEGLLHRRVLCSRHALGELLDGHDVDRQAVVDRGHGFGSRQGPQSPGQKHDMRDR